MLKAIIQFILSLFQKKDSTPLILPKPLALLHPEEPKNPAATVANTSVESVLMGWFGQWAVPVASQDFFRKGIEIKIFDSWSPEQLAQFGIPSSTPAFTFGDDKGRHFYSLAAWINPGVVAHEEAHNSYSLLTEDEKKAFSVTYGSLRNIDPLIVFLYSINEYGLTSDVEGHAEVYRYLGAKMPGVLKMFYPKLMEV